MSTPRLSICIATFKRASFIAETLNSIVGQLSPDVELLVVDGASPDSTEQVMREYVSRNTQVRYFREPVNSGVDRDYDRAVGYAQGEYCWLMTDDDLLLPGAVDRVLQELDRSADFVFVNAEVRTKDLSRILNSPLAKITANRKYSEGDGTKVFEDLGFALSFIGCVVIRRSFWQARDRAAYFGSLFIHVGVLFQAPPVQQAVAIAAPLIRIRYGNAMWAPRAFEIWMIKWPGLIWSFTGFPEASLNRVSRKDPWRNPKHLALLRALGAYTLAEYRRQLSSRADGLSRHVAFAIAALPAGFWNGLFSIVCATVHRGARTAMYDLLRSTHSSWLTRCCARTLRLADE